MPLPYGWGTGGIQVTAAVLGADDVLKVIDQGATTPPTPSPSAVLRAHGRRGDHHRTREATIIQTRHRIPGAPLREGRSSSTRCRSPSRCLPGAARAETRRMHALEEYGLMHVKLYEDIARHGHIDDLRLSGEGRRPLRDGPSPIPKFDNPKMDMHAGAAAVRRRPREAASTPCRPTPRRQPRLRGPPVRGTTWDHGPARCAGRDSYLDEVVTDDEGGRMFVCSDTDYCASRARGRSRRFERFEQTRCSARPRASRSATGADRLRATSLRPTRPARCWHRRRVGLRQDHAAQCLSTRGCARGRQVSYRTAVTVRRRCIHAEPKRSAASCCAPTGASSTRTAPTACAWASAPAPMSASG
jgi:alpha-D-ribose 1-methylphosphonate 5-phosphate C-P lyase